MSQFKQYTYFYCTNLLIFSASAQEYEFFDAHERCSKGTGEYLMPIGLIRHLEVNIGPNLCSTRRLVEDFVLDVQQKFSTRRLVAEKQLPTRRLLEGVNIYQTSSSRKIALLDVQQNFYWIPSRTFTRRLVDQMIWVNAYLQVKQVRRVSKYVLTYQIVDV